MSSGDLAGLAVVQRGLSAQLGQSYMLAR